MGAYEDEKLKDSILKTTFRNEMQKYEIPEKFNDNRHNMRRTQISEYSNALFNGEVFINPYYLSC